MELKIDRYDLAYESQALYSYDGKIPHKNVFLKGPGDTNTYVALRAFDIWYDIKAEVKEFMGVENMSRNTFDEFRDRVFAGNIKITMKEKAREKRFEILDADSV